MLHVVLWNSWKRVSEMKARYAKQIRFGIEAAKVYLNEGYTDKERASMWYAAISARDLTWKSFQHTVLKTQRDAIS